MRLAHLLSLSLLTLTLAVVPAVGFAGDEKHEHGERCSKDGTTCAATETGDSKLAACPHAHAEGEDDHSRPGDGPRIGLKTDDGFYPVSTCMVTGETLSPDSAKVQRFEVDGRTVMTCCPGCKTKVEADPARWIANLDEMIIAQQTADYPIANCPVTGEELGEAPSAFIVDNYLIKTCCGGCDAKVIEDPSAVLAELEAFWSTPAEVIEVAVVTE